MGWWSRLFGRRAAAAPPAALPAPEAEPAPVAEPEPAPAEGSVDPTGDISAVHLDAALKRLREEIPAPSEEKPPGSSA